MKIALLASLGLLMTFGSYAQNLTRWSGTTFTELEGKAACENYITELTTNLSQIDPKKLLIIESSCVSRGKDKGYSPKLTYQSSYFRLMETYSWMVEDPETCLDELATVANAVNNSSLTYGAGRCPKRVNLEGQTVPTGKAEIVYVAEESQNIKSLTLFAPDFEVRENCVQTMNIWKQNFEKNSLSVLRQSCSSYTRGLGTKKFYSPSLVFVLPLGKQIQTLSGPRGKTCQSFISEEVLNQNELPFLFSYCHKTGEEIQQKVVFLDDLLPNVRRYQGLTYDNASACGESLAALSLNLNSRKYTVLSQFCEQTGKTTYRPVLYHLWKQTITKP